MTKTGIILTLAILLPLSALAGKKKQQQSDGTDWLNAPTPDGSPTLKETSDWLAKTLADYGGSDWDTYPARVADVGIDNTCTFRWKAVTDPGKHSSYDGFAVPLGAVTSVAISPQSSDGHNWLDLNISTGNVAAIRGSGGSVPATEMSWIVISRMPAPKLNAPTPETPEQMAPRIQKALQHAVDLCRSTYQAPAQSKELF